MHKRLTWKCYQKNKCSVYVWNAFVSVLGITISLTRAHPVVSAEHQRPGGVDFRPPLRSRKLRRLEKNGKRRLVDWEKHYKKHSDNFSLEVKIEVTRGHQGQNFPKFLNYMTWLHIMRIISVPVTATSKFKKAIESSWNALSLRWRPDFT